jgi:mutator protein MutT
MSEVIDVVDENDNVIGSATRQEVRRKNLLHRGVAVLVLNSKGEVFVHKRAKAKDIYPSMYDMFCGGTVLAGESYDEAAIREVREEMGIKNPQLKFLFKFRFKSDINKVMQIVYLCIYDGKIRIQKEEIEKGSFMTINELKELMKKETFCPEAPAVFKRYEKMQKQRFH